MSEPTVIDNVRRALGRVGPMTPPPAPPMIDEPVTRLVHTDIGLAELFVKRAQDQKMAAAVTVPALAVMHVIEFLREHRCRQIVLAESDLLRKLGLPEGLRDAGFEFRFWSQITLDELYDGFDCAITDVSFAVAETATLVLRPHAGHGRGLSLVPMHHVAIVEAAQLLPDLVDLFERLATEAVEQNVIMISGPSKTADIEMNVVTGVHGPNVVQAIILQ
jgi:L-lactate utilization protein LutC